MGGIDLGSVKAKIEVDASGVDAGVQQAKTALDGFSSSAVAMGAAVGAGVALATTALLKMAGAALGAARDIAGTVAEVAAYSEQIDKMAKVTGLSTDMIQGLGKAAQESGANSEVLIKAIAKMEAAIGNDSKAIKEMGLSLTQLKNSSPEEMLQTVSTRLLSMTDVTERNAAAQKLLGRAYMDVLPALEQYASSADRYVNLSNAQIAAGKDMDDALDAIGTAWKELGQQIGAALNTPEVREALRSLASSIREMALAVKDGKGPIAAFFESIATGAQNAAKWFVFLGGAMAGMKERMASLNKDTPGAIARGMEALEAFDKRVAADKNKAWGREMFPSMFEQPTGGGGGGGGISSEVQSEMDRLSGAKAQKEVDLISESVARLGTKGVNDLAGLGKQLVDLASKGAKIPDSLRPAIQAFAQTAAMKDVPQLAKKAWDEMTKDAEGNIAKQSALKIKAWKEDEKAAKANADAITAIGQSQTDMLQRQLQDGTLSVRQEFEIRRGLIVAQTQEAINQLQQRRDAATDPAIVAALNEEIAKWEQLRQAELEATDEALRYAEISDAFGKLGAVLGGVSDLFDAIGISADSAVGKIVSGMQVAVASVQNFAAQTTTAGKIGAGLSAAANIYKTGQEKGAVAGGISGAATGAAIGTMIAPGIGTVIGGAAGLILGIAGGLRKPEYKKIMADVGKSWGVSISEGLAKEIEQIAKTNKISRSMAELLSTSKIIGESGKDPREFTKKIEDLMNAIKTGAVPAAQGMAELGKSFDLVANAALEAGTVGDKALVGLLKRAREMGQVTPEMKAFAGAQLDSAVQGISKYVKAIETLSKAAKEGGEAQVRFAKIGETSGVVFGAVFQAMVSEKGITAAVDAMKSEFDSLHQTLFDSLGPEATATILGPFGGAFATLGDETLRPIFEGIDGITQAMTGLANAGYLSTDQFGAMQDATAQLFDEAVAGGADMRTALLAVAPGIQAAISAAEQFGIPLDADMVRLKQLAEQNNITFATDPQAAMLDVLVSIAQVLGADVPASARRAADSMRDLANSVPGDLNVNMNVNRHYSESYSGGGGGWGGGGGGEMPGGEVPFVPPEVFNPGEAMNEWPGYQHGSDGVQDFGPGTPAVLHGREAVVTEKQLQSMGGASVSFNPTFTVDPLMTNESRAQLSQYQIEEFVRQVRANPLFQQILRDQGLR